MRYKKHPQFLILFHPQICSCFQCCFGDKNALAGRISMLAASQGCRAESLLYKQSWDGTEKPLCTLALNTSAPAGLSASQDTYTEPTVIYWTFPLVHPSSVWIFLPFPFCLSSLTANVFFIKLKPGKHCISSGSSEMRAGNSGHWESAAQVHWQYKFWLKFDWNLGLSAQNICDIYHYPELHCKALELIIYMTLSFVFQVLRDEIWNEWKKRSNLFTTAFCTSIFVLQFFILRYHRGTEFSFSKQLLHLK